MSDAVFFKPYISYISRYIFQNLNAVCYNLALYFSIHKRGTDLEA